MHRNLESLDLNNLDVHLFSEVQNICLKTRPRDKALFRKLQTEKFSSREDPQRPPQPQALVLGSAEASSKLANPSYNLSCLLAPRATLKSPIMSLINAPAGAAANPDLLPMLPIQVRRSRIRKLNKKVAQL